jgi:hypothetical protein
MTHYFKPASLNSQIEDTEQQIAKHQRAIDAHSKALTSELRQAIKLTPAHLLLASGIGFILGELTKCQSIEATDHAPAGETSPLKVAFNLLTTARSLYAALPLVLMISSRYQQPQTTKEKCHERSH